MTAARYIEQVLEGAWMPFYEKVRKETGREVLFQQDGAPAHGAKITQAWMRQRKVRVFPHPPSSPDVSAIEPVWGLLKHRLRQLPRTPTSVNELMRTFQRLWDELTIDEINHFVDQMPDRIEAVIRARGGHTKY